MTTDSTSPNPTAKKPKQRKLGRGGRPRRGYEKYRPGVTPILAKILYQHGMTDGEVAHMLNVQKREVDNWKHKPEFREAMKLSKDEVDAQVENALLHRAKGYSHKAVKFITVAGQVVEREYVEQYPPDTTACIFWLKNRRSKQWRDKIEIGDEIIKSLRSLMDSVGSGAIPLPKDEVREIGGG